MATQVNFVVDQGTAFSAIAEIENEDGSIFDLTDLTPYSQMRKSYYTNTYIDIDVAVEGLASNGELKLSLSPVASSAIRAGRYVYDVEVHDVSGDYVKRVLQGIITISPQVTKPVT